MSDDVKGGRRPYDASGRRERARVARQAVLRAAQQRFEADGFAATTIARVAEAAGVSAESIYKNFGSKAVLLKEVFDVAIAGDDDAVPVAERPETRRIQAEPDVREKLRLYALQAGERAARSARIQLVIRNGAAAEPALRELWDRLLEERLTGMTMLARHLVASGGLRVEVDEARDVLWTCISVEVYDLLVHERGWSTAAYSAWLDRTLAASLLR